MKRIALDVTAGDGSIEKAEIECRVVPDENGAPAVVCANSVAHLAEDALKRIALRDGRPQWVIGVDAGDGERGWIEIRALEGNDVIGVRVTWLHHTVLVHVDRHGCNLEQRIGCGVETAAFHVDDHWQEAAKTARHDARACRELRGRFGRFSYLIDVSIAHRLASGTKRQAIRSPARKGTSVSGFALCADPKGNSSGTAQPSLTSLICPALRGKP